MFCPFMRRTLAVLLATVGLLVPSSPLLAQEADPSPLHLLTSTATQTTLELRLPAFALEPVETAEGRYVRLNVPGLVDAAPPAHPRLPQIGVLLGLPPTGGWSVEVLTVERQTIALLHPLLPAAVPDATPPGFGIAPPLPLADRTAAETSAAADTFAPASWVETGEVAILRDLRVLPLTLHPYRYNPLRKELEYASRMVVRVRFEEPAAGRRAARPPDRWDSLFDQVIVNYDRARAWRERFPSPALSRRNVAATAADSFKVEVEADGLYQITYADLEAAGFPLMGSDARNLRLTAGGQEVAVWVEGEDDGRLDPGDRLLFYGQAAQSRYTRRNVYWLAVGETPGRRMSTRDVTPGDIYPTPEAYWQTLHFEKNYLYDSKHAEASGDHWYWTDLGFLQTGCPDAVQTYTFSLPRLRRSTYTALLRLSVQGYTPGSHHLAVWLNNQRLGDIKWEDAQRAEAEFAVDAVRLNGYGNTLRLENGDCPPPPPPSPPPNGMAFNYFEMVYQAMYQATGGLLDFWGERGNWQYQVEGFSSGAPLLFDITDAAAPVLLSGGRQTDTHLVFQDVTTQSRRYLAVDQSGLRSPAALYRDTPSNLTDAANRADYVLIGYGPFLAAAQPLVDLRAAQGLETMVVDVQDVYDEFRGGLLDPGAIHDFLAYALASWQLPPTYVLLVGDGTIDYLDHLDQGWRNFVPAYPADVDPYLGETAADNRLACVAGGDILPDLHIGRLPTATAAETEALVAKIIGYESTPPDFWDRHVLLVADNDDGAGDFAQDSDLLYERLSAPMVGERIYLAAEPTQPYEYDSTDPAGIEAARLALRDRFAQGRFLVTFTGHSSHSQWAQERLLHRDDVPALQNGDRLPVVLSLTCYTAAFHYPPYDPLDERLVQEAGGGAIAAWGSTGSGISTGHRPLAQGFFDAVFGETPVSLGAATYTGKMRLYNQAPANRDLVDTYVLLGDPATILYPYSGAVYRTYLPLVSSGHSSVR